MPISFCNLDTCLGEHGGHLGHLRHQILGKRAHPLRQRLHVDRLHDLIRRALLVRHPDALLPVFVNKVVVVHHRFVERQVEKVEDDAQPSPRMEHQLFVVDDHAAAWADLVALIVHRLDDGVPPLQALPWIVEVVAGNGDLN